MQMSGNVVPLFGAEQAAGALARVSAEAAARWRKVRALAQLWWNELDEDDLCEATGREDLARVVQRRLGRSRDVAELEVNRFLARVERTLQGN
jgi:hypothetical protein